MSPSQHSTTQHGRKLVPSQASTLVRFSTPFPFGNAPFTPLVLKQARKASTILSKVLPLAACGNILGQQEIGFWRDSQGSARGEAKSSVFGLHFGSRLAQQKQTLVCSTTIKGGILLVHS